MGLVALHPKSWTLASLAMSLKKYQNPVEIQESKSKEFNLNTMKSINLNLIRMALH